MLNTSTIKKKSINAAINTNGGFIAQIQKNDIIDDINGFNGINGIDVDPFDSFNPLSLSKNDGNAHLLKMNGSIINQINEYDIGKAFHSQENKIFTNGKTEEKEEIEKGKEIKTEKIEEEIKKEEIKTEKIEEGNKTEKKEEEIKDDDNNNDNNKLHKTIINTKLIIKADDNLYEFCVSDENNILLGCFTMADLVKYLNNSYDTEKQFLNKKNKTKEYHRAMEIIKKIIFKLEYNKTTNYTNIILNDSAFMKDIELLIKLNNYIYEYQNKNFQTDLFGVNLDNKIKMEKNTKKFILLLLNHTLKQISIISETLKDNNNKKELKEKMLDYSIGLVYRINLIVKEQMTTLNKENKSIKKSIDENIMIKKELNNKLDVIIDKINKNDIAEKNISNDDIDKNIDNNQNVNINNIEFPNMVTLNDIEIDNQIETSNIAIFNDIDNIDDIDDHLESFEFNVEKLFI